MLREQLTDIAEFDRAEAWRGDGAGSMIAWVTDKCGVASSTARQWVNSATHLEALPSLSDGLATGAISLDKVAPLAEVASPATDAELRSTAEQCSVKQIRDLMEWHRATQDALAGSAVREFENRTLRFNDARRTMWVAFTRDEYALAKSALVGRVSSDERNPRASSVPTGRSGPMGAQSQGYVPYDKRLYDVLLEVLRGASAGVGRIGVVPAAKVGTRGASGSSGSGATSHRGAGVNRGTSRALRPRLIVHAPLELLLGAESGTAEIEGAGPVAAEVVRRLACDAHITLSAERPDGMILDQGRARRDPTTAQRIEIARRDKGCRFPGCPYREFTDVHHMRHWIDGGLTNLDNLITLCGRHHNAVHELGWTMAGDANAEVAFTSPTGQTMNSVPSPTWRMSRRNPDTS